MIHEDIIILLVGEHPHSGELAHPVGASAETVEVNDLGQYLLHLIECKHGVEGCYASKKNMKLLYNKDIE